MDAGAWEIVGHGGDPAQVTVYWSKKEGTILRKE